MLVSRKAVVGVSAGVVAATGLGLGLGLALTSGGCQADPAAQIAALPAGGTFYGSGCYDTAGIVTKANIDGGTYENTATAKPAKGNLNPIIRVLNAQNVTIENVTVQGANTDGTYHSKLINEAGFRLDSSSNVSLLNDNAVNIFGDGVEMFKKNVKGTFNYNVTVTNLTVTNAGRFGVTPALVYGLTMSGVNIGNTGLLNINFESDVGAGSGDVSITNSTFKGIQFNEPLSGTVNLTNNTMSGHILAYAKSITTPITVSGGTLVLPGTDHGTPPAGIYMKGGTLTLQNVAVTAAAAGKQAKPGLAYVVLNSGALNLINTPMPQPGTYDSTSTVNIIP